MSKIESAVTRQSCDFNFSGLAAETIALYAFGAGLLSLADASSGLAGRALNALVTSAHPANGPGPQAQYKSNAALAQNPAVA